MAATKDERPATAWAPSFWSRMFGAGSSWSPGHPAGRVGGLEQTTTAVVAVEAITVQPGRIWSTVIVTGPRGTQKLSGLSKVNARTLQTALARCRNLTALRAILDRGFTQVAGWATTLDDESQAWEHRWWPRELSASDRRT